MNFKKIEIFGFKSFADKTVIEFNNGITGIVGPNGCGKSNVADAIRWVLGEQSPKLLRGKNMQDVIFKGTQRRTPLSFCEVILTFDNTNKIFAKMPYEEVSIGRKLYTNGESEYIINNETCRLKDVQDLIRDTGLGREGYSIVGQGRVDEIVNAKPKDRRGIFEDAAGVLTYKVRKLDAQRKLDRAKDNIERLDDIINELIRQLTPLEKQSQSARKFLDIVEELKDLEVNEYIYKFENSDKTRGELIQKLDGIEQEKAQAEKDFEKANIDYSGKNIELGNIDVYIGKLRDEQTAMAVSAESIKGQGNTLNERISNMTEQRSTLHKQLIELEQQLDDKTNILDDYQNKRSMQREEEQEISSECRQLSDEYLAMADEILKREHLIEQKNLELQKALEDMGDIKANLGTLKAKQENYIERIQELDLEISKYKQDIEQDEFQKVDKEKIVNRIVDEKSKLAAGRNQVLFELNQFKVEIENSKEEIIKVNGSINALQTKQKLLENFKNDYESFSGAVRKLAQAAKQNPEVGNRMLGFVADIIKTPKEYELCIETVLGNNLQNVITKDEDDAKKLIEFLKQNRFGRITFLPLTSFKARELEDNLKGALKENGCLGIASKLVDYDKKFDKIVTGLLGRTLVCKDMYCAIAISKKYNYNLKIVTLQGDIINPSGSIVGGSQRSENSNVLSKDREIKETAELLYKAKTRYQELLDLTQNGNAQMQEMTAQLNAYQEDVKQAEITYATEMGKLDKIKSRLALALQEMNSRQQLKEKIEADLKTINTAISAFDEQGAGVIDFKSNVDNETSRSKAEFDKKKAERERLSELMQNAQIKLSKVQTEISALNEIIDRYQQEVDVLKDSIAECSKNIKSVEDKISAAERSLNTVSVSKEDKARYQEIIEELASLDTYKKKLNSEIAQLLEHKDAVAKRIQTVGEQRIKQQAQIEKVDAIMAAMQQHIFEEYELVYESALQYKRDDFNMAEASGRITSLRRQKSALGPVNVNAIDEYIEVSKRYEELSEQRDDLVNTANDCLAIIEEMSKEMKTRFDKAFEIINKNFQYVFKELFGGGEGKLIIEKPEEGEDPLSAGIEIYAMPPGKSLKSITLFSGGEKALIAIAILFAILRLKAMPFCVLDEIEAALDDSNVGLFAKYLGRFSKETQFIVITHRKPTMELADRLYGVTMQEKGISKVVTVSLTDAVDM